MTDRLKILEDTMTLLMSVTPDTPLGKLLNLCLAAKADANLGLSARELAKKLIEEPEKITYWTMEVIGSDGNYTEAEWKALGDLKLDDAEEFIKSLQSELEDLDFD